MGKTLTIIEVSQKQAYIFASNKLKENINKSAEIAYITSNEYLRKISGYDESKNLIYSGGGHTILEFEDENQAKEFGKELTRKVHVEIPDIEFFIKNVPFEEAENPQEKNGDKITRLIRELERKKSKRSAVFHQGTFGIEKILAETLKPDRVGKKIDTAEFKKHNFTIDINPYELVEEFDKLGGSKEKSNYIAVVHIDGNGMGKRVNDFYNRVNNKDWSDFKKSVRAFSESIAKDYRDAFQEMCNEVVKQLDCNNLKQLSLDGKNFPVRRIISEADDITFVTEGRIGIECAVTFINALQKKTNQEDNKGYSACAGVAIVHQKYPFYRAYQLAEELCSNAKKYVATLSDTGDMSAIDWHIDQGELRDSINDIREAFLTTDSDDSTKVHLEMRPYNINPKQGVLEGNDIFRDYSYIKRKVRELNSPKFAARSKVKNLRQAIKMGESETEGYVKFNKIENLFPCTLNKEPIAFATMSDGEKHSTVFDAIEIMDTFIPFE